MNAGVGPSPEALLMAFAVWGLIFFGYCFACYVAFLFCKTIYGNSVKFTRRMWDDPDG